MIQNCIHWARKGDIHTVVDEIYALSIHEPAMFRRLRRDSRSCLVLNDNPKRRPFIKATSWRVERNSSHLPPNSSDLERRTAPVRPDPVVRDKQFSFQPERRRHFAFDFKVPRERTAKHQVVLIVPGNTADFLSVADPVRMRQSLATSPFVKRADRRPVLQRGSVRKFFLAKFARFAQSLFSE